MKLFNKIIPYKLFKFLHQEDNSEKDVDEERLMNDSTVDLSFFLLYRYRYQSLAPFYSPYR
jgi:hypothetical protein